MTQGELQVMLTARAEREYRTRQQGAAAGTEPQAWLAALFWPAVAVAVLVSAAGCAWLAAVVWWGLGR
jgi:hypothetical protein